MSGLSAHTAKRTNPGSFYMALPNGTVVRQGLQGSCLAVVNLILFRLSPIEGTGGEYHSC